MALESLAAWKPRTEAIVPVGHGWRGVESRNARQLTTSAFDDAMVAIALPHQPWQKGGMAISGKIKSDTMRRCESVKGVARAPICPIQENVMELLLIGFSVCLLVVCPQSEIEVLQLPYILHWGTDKVDRAYWGLTLTNYWPYLMQLSQLSRGELYCI